MLVHPRSLQLLSAALLVVVIGLTFALIVQRRSRESHIQRMLERAEARERHMW